MGRALAIRKTFGLVLRRLLTYALGRRRPKHRYRDRHHVRHGGWRLSCDTAIRIGAIAC